MARYPNGMFQGFAASEFALGTNEALEKAKALRDKKIISLAKQADKILKMEIKVTP